MRFANETGFYELNPFPGCNQLVVSNHAFIEPSERGKGLGQVQHQERLEAAQYLKYDAIVCTVRADNHREKHILEKGGWTKLWIFVNRETTHLVELWGKQLG